MLVLSIIFNTDEDFCISLKSVKVYKGWQMVACKLAVALDAFWVVQPVLVCVLP